MKDRVKNSDWFVHDGDVTTLKGLQQQLFISNLICQVSQPQGYYGNSTVGENNEVVSCNLVVLIKRTGQWIIGA